MVDSTPIRDWSASCLATNQDIYIHGPGEAHGVRIGSRNEIKRFRVTYREPPAWAPRILLNPRNYFAYFTDCDFSGMHTTHFDPGPSRFIRCKFTNVHLTASPSALLDAHFIDCQLSGYFEANLTHIASSVDAVREKPFHGNDFSGVTGGLQFLDTRMSDLQLNVFAAPRLDGHYVVVGQDLPGWDTVKTVLKIDPELRHLDFYRILSGPRRWQWQLVYRDQMSTESWEKIISAMRVASASF